MNINRHILTGNGQLALATVLVVLVGVVAYICLPWLSLQFKIDDCLDKGGRWDYGAEICTNSPAIDD